MIKEKYTNVEYSQPIIKELTADQASLTIMKDYNSYNPMQIMTVELSEDERTKFNIVDVDHTAIIYPLLDGNKLFAIKTFWARHIQDPVRFFLLGCDHKYEYKNLNRKGTYVEYTCMLCKHNYTIDSGD